MALSFDDLTTWYNNTVRERELAARTAPDPQTPVEFAQAQLAAIGNNRDAITLLLEYIVAALADLDSRVAAAPKAKASASTTTAATTATSAGSVPSASA